MSGDKIEEIRVRHLREDRWRYSPSSQMHGDRAILLAEVDRLRAEIERLREENKEKQAAFHATHVERDDLRATIKRMREQLKDPNVVALNMLHGKIALPSVEQIKHIYQERFLPPDKATVVSERDEALEGKP